MPTATYNMSIGSHKLKTFSIKQIVRDLATKTIHREYHLTLSLPETTMETCNVVLTFESVDGILWCDHSNETSSAVLSRGTICN